jgi:preprotein translocase subunit YajC
VKKTGILLSMLTLLLSLASCTSITETTATDGSTTSSGFLSYLPMIIILVLLFGLFYFMMVRPMRQREKKHDQMVEQLHEGDRVITAGGIYGEIDTISQDSVIIKIESGAKMKVTKGSILGLNSTENK